MGLDVKRFEEANGNLRVNWGLSNNGKENGNYYIIFRVYIGFRV